LQERQYETLLTNTYSTRLTKRELRTVSTDYLRTKWSTWTKWTNK